MNILKLLFLSLIAIVCCCTVSCKQPIRNIAAKDAINQKDSCRLNPGHTYQIIVPTIGKYCANLPLMVVIDPHGAGKYAVGQFQEVVQKYPAIVVASNLIKNNFAGYIQSLDQLITDVKSKYPVGDQIYISGFSGGARMAIDYAISHQVTGLIACGALAQPEQIKAVNCTIMAVIGMDDFNFAEVAQYIVNPSNTPQNLMIELTNASHAWPEKELLTNVFGYLKLSSVNATNCTYSKSMAKDYFGEQKLLVDSLTRSNEAIKAALIARNMTKMNSSEKNSSFSLVYENLVNSEAYASQLDELTQSIRFEFKVRKAYYNALQQKDAVWWRKEINTLNSKIESEQNRYTQMAYRRIKGFLGIVCFSLSNRYSTSREREKLEQILAVYRMVEPDNADMLAFSKILEQLKGNIKRP
jgi:dienelactone hydrolase